MDHRMRFVVRLNDGKSMAAERENPHWGAEDLRTSITIATNLRSLTQFLHRLEK